MRSGMRKMGELSGLPIEPRQQSELLDASIVIPGVVGGGVPGAGGYDAIWLLIIDREETIREVEDVWSAMKGLRVTPLQAAESQKGGLHMEDIDEVPGIKDAWDRWRSN